LERSRMVGRLGPERECSGRADQLKCLSLGNVKKATKAKVAVFSCGLDIAQTETKGTVLLKKAEELLDFSRGEEKQLEGVRIQISADVGEAR
jgi:hypothetical protein